MPPLETLHNWHQEASQASRAAPRKIGQLPPVEYRLAMRKSILERDYPGQQAFPGEEKRFFVVPSIQYDAQKHLECHFIPPGVELMYDNHHFKIPQQSRDYAECSAFVIQQIEAIITAAMDSGRNKILINTNLKLGLPMENINKIAGPFVEAWAVEVFSEAIEDEENTYDLLNVEAGERLNFADVILQFRRRRKHCESVTGHIDVKATSKDIKNSGKSPNITSFARIRTEYVKNPDLIFIILAIKHSVYSSREEETKMMIGVMEVVDFNAYDLKHLSDRDLSYNPALGSGQIQVRDIHYISLTPRTTWEFCQLLDRKCITSRRGYDEWLRYAKQNQWIKDD